jgi:hypothetical protein
MSPSANGVTNVAAAVAPGAIGAMVESDGKHDIEEQPAGIVGNESHTLTQPTAKPCGRVPLFVRVTVTCEMFCVAMRFFAPASSPPVEVKPVSLTAMAMVYVWSLIPSLSG